MKKNQNRIIFRLKISAEDYLLHYQTPNIEVFTESIDGRSVRFPASLLRPFVTHHGIQGLFALDYDRNNKCSGLYKID